MPHLVTAIIKPFKLEEVKEALRSAGVLGLTVSEVQGYGRQGGKSEVFRGSEYKVDFVPKVKIEVLVESPQAEKIMDIIAEAARGGRFAEGSGGRVEASTSPERSGGVGSSGSRPPPLGRGDPAWRTRLRCCRSWTSWGKRGAAATSGRTSPSGPRTLTSSTGAASTSGDARR